MPQPAGVSPVKARCHGGKSKVIAPLGVPGESTGRVGNRVKTPLYSSMMMVRVRTPSLPGCRALHNVLARLFTSPA
jgi:hypothetical protein